MHTGTLGLAHESYEPQEGAFKIFLSFFFSWNKCPSRFSMTFKNTLDQTNEETTLSRRQQCVWRWSIDNKSKFCTVTVHNCHQPREFLVYLLLWQWGSNEIGSNWKKKMILTVIINNGLLMRLVEWPFQILHLTPIFWYSTGHIRVGTLSQALMLSAFSPVIDL